MQMENRDFDKNEDQSPNSDYNQYKEDLKNYYKKKTSKPKVSKELKESTSDTEIKEETIVETEEQTENTEQE